MVDKKVIEKICKYADLSGSDTVLEIGAGTGNLTEILVRKSGFVYAIEKDKYFYDTLKKKFSNFENIEIINADALKVNFPEFDKVVSNLPYEISREITEKLLREEFKLGVLVYQKEFAEKLLAQVGSKNYRYISALAQSCADIKILDIVSPEAFFPQPKIFSAIVRLKSITLVEQHYIDFLHSLFNQRNKKIKNLIKGGIPLKFQEMRAFELKPNELRRIYLNLS